MDSYNGTSTTLATGLFHINIFLKNGEVIVTQVIYKVFKQFFKKKYV